MYSFYAVFGRPVLHSKSPQLFAPLTEKKKNCFYTRIRPRSAGDISDIVRSLNIMGASITSPFKEDIIPYTDHLSKDALDIGAVNCIRLKNGRIEGHNTDHYGVTGALREAGLEPGGARVMVLGAGGAAKAAVYGLVNAGARVTVSNRTATRARELADAFGCELISWNNPPGSMRFDAVVSALLPEALPPFADQLEYDLLLDAVYKPSAISMFSKKRGVRLIGGERWLIHQGIKAAEFYMEETAEADRLGEKLGERPAKDRLEIFILNSESSAEFFKRPHDLVISAEGLDSETIKLIKDEEMRLAFGS